MSDKHGIVPVSISIWYYSLKVMKAEEIYNALALSLNSVSIPGISVIPEVNMDHTKLVLEQNGALGSWNKIGKQSLGRISSEPME